MWQQTVSAFAASTTLSLIDVSMVSENVLWEIDHLQHELGGRCVYVGERDRLVPLSTVPAPGSIEEEVQRRLDGISVLAYTTDPKGVRRFTRALRATLEEPRRTHRPLTSIPQVCPLRCQTGALQRANLTIAPAERRR